jgi:hypothetical protein
MPHGSDPETDSRQAPRLKLPAMYTLIRVRPQGNKRYCWTGHIYDISASGMRFELDAPLQPGTLIEVRATLPGPNSTTVNITGRIVRYHDEPNEPGPIRMGMVIDSYTRPVDRSRLSDYLQHSGLNKAA